MSKVPLHQSGGSASKRDGNHLNGFQDFELRAWPRLSSMCHILSSYFFSGGLFQVLEIKSRTWAAQALKPALFTIKNETLNRTGKAAHSAVSRAGGLFSFSLLSSLELIDTTIYEP